jgi:hypothetical protein
VYTNRYLSQNKLDAAIFILLDVSTDFTIFLTNMQVHNIEIATTEEMMPL